MLGFPPLPLREGLPEFQNGKVSKYLKMLRIFDETSTLARRENLQSKFLISKWTPLPPPGKCSKNLIFFESPAFPQAVTCMLCAQWPLDKLGHMKWNRFWKLKRKSPKESKMLLRSVKILLRILKEAIACSILPVGMFSFCPPCLWQISGLALLSQSGSGCWLLVEVDLVLKDESTKFI